MAGTRNTTNPSSTIDGICQAIVKKTGNPCLRKTIKGMNVCGYHRNTPSNMNTSLTTEDSYCAICMDDNSKQPIPKVTTPCNHTFHKACLDKWNKRSNTCPMCRAHIRCATKKPSSSPSVMHPQQPSSSYVVLEYNFDMTLVNIYHRHSM